MLFRSLPILVGAAITLSCATSYAQADFADSEGAKWRDFGIGSWKLVRVYKEVFDEKGNIESSSIDETRSTLVKLTDEGYTIKADVTVEVAGRRLQAEPQYFEKSWSGQNGNDELVIQQAGERGVKITGRVYPTSIHEILLRGQGSKRHSTVFFSGDVAPHVLRMETSVTDPTGKKTRADSVVEVIALDMPFRVLSEIKSTSHVRIWEQLHTSGREKLTVEIHCPDVPGWVVSHTSKVLDKEEDRVVERTTLELLDYETLVTESRQPVVTRRRGRRARRGGTR